MKTSSKWLLLLVMVLSIPAVKACADTHQKQKVSAGVRHIHVSWNGSGIDPLGYNVYRISCGKRLFKDAGTRAGTCAGKIEPAGFTSKTYLDDLVLGDSTYEYYATTVDSFGHESGPSQTVLITVDAAHATN